MIPAWAADYIGFPYRALGRDRDGLDCWGLYRLVRGERFGQWLDGYEYDPVPLVEAATLARESQLAAIVPLGAERLGDAVFLRLAGVVCHLGMVLGDGMMLHIREGAGSAIESYHAGQWARRVEAFRRP